jgi:CheY-like chemotaxis protein
MAILDSQAEFPLGKILIVDDEMIARLTLSQILSLSGFSCTTARNGREALELARTFEPQVIIMDLRMPKMDGLEATRLLKADPETHNIPIFALTGSTTAEDRRQAMEAGVDLFLTKPLNVDRLLQHLGVYAIEPQAAGQTRG